MCVRLAGDGRRLRFECRVCGYKQAKLTRFRSHVHSKHMHTFRSVLSRDTNPFQCATPQFEHLFVLFRLLCRATLIPGRPVGSLALVVVVAVQDPTSLCWIPLPPPRLHPTPCIITCWSLGRGCVIFARTVSFSKTKNKAKTQRERTLINVAEKKHLACEKVGKGQAKSSGYIGSASAIHASFLARRYLCSFCSKEFASKESFDAHEVTHQPIRARRTFPCTECTKTFTSSGALKVHCRTHTGTAALRSVVF